MANESPNPTQSATQQPKRSARRRWAPALLAIVILVAGAVAGGAVTTYCITDRFHLRPRDPSKMPERVVDRMRRKLDISDQQAHDIRQVLDRHFTAIMALKEEVRPRMQSQFQAMEIEVAQLLTPEQASEWNSWCEKRFRERWSRGKKGACAPRRSDAQSPPPPPE